MLVDTVTMTAGNTDGTRPKNALTPETVPHALMLCKYDPGALECTLHVHSFKLDRVPKIGNPKIHTILVKLRRKKTSQNA